MELKTFKNLEIYHQDRVLLKQEAIKWLKEFNKPQLTEETNKFYTGYESIDAIILWINYFFNITEEDLK